MGSYIVNKSHFEFISDYFELPVLDRNKAWLTSVWVYYIIAIIGAVTGVVSLVEYFSGSDFMPAAMITLKFGLLVTLMTWCGCTATAFLVIPDTKFALRRSIFNLIVIALVFYVCAILSVLALIAVAMMVAGILLASGGSSLKSSLVESKPDDGMISDGHGNYHYVEKSLGNGRVQANGENWRREADGSYRRIN